jgi:hypothetical protein
MTTTPELEDLLTHAHSDELASEWECEQAILALSGYNQYLDEQEKQYWENLAKKSEGFSCQH